MSKFLFDVVLGRKYTLQPESLSEGTEAEDNVSVSNSDEDLLLKKPALSRIITYNHNQIDNKISYTIYSDDGIKITGELEQSVDSNNLMKAIIDAEIKKEEDSQARQGLFEANKKVAADKLFQLVKVLNELREQHQISLYTIENHLQMFFDSLSPDEIKEVLLFQEDLHKTFGRWNFWGGKWSDRYMTFFYFLLTGASLLGSTLGVTGAMINPRLSFGFGNNIVEIVTDAFWNIGIDSAAGLTQAARQNSRGEKFIARLNIISSTGMIACSAAAIAELALGNVQFAADLSGWSFAFAMFFCAGVEIKSFWRCKQNTENSIKKLEEKEGFGIRTEEFQQLRNTTNVKELVKLSAKILGRFEIASPGYNECEQRLNMIIRERAEANNHFRMSIVWGVCGVSMSLLAGASTWLTVQTGGASLGATAIALPIINNVVAFTSAIFRSTVAVFLDDSVNAEKAIKARDELLSDPARRPGDEPIKNYTIIIGNNKPKDDALTPSCINLFYESDVLMYRVKWNNGEIKSGSITSKDISIGTDKITPENLNQHENDILNAIAQRGHIVREIADIKGSKNYIKKALNLTSSAVKQIGIHSHESFFEETAQLPPSSRSRSASSTESETHQL